MSHGTDTIATQRGRGTRRLGCLAIFSTALFLGILGLRAGNAAAALPVPTNCQDDIGGANDEPGQKDVTRFCVDSGDSMPYELYTLANWDDTTLSGNNTADVCILFDTDNDGFVNLAVCATLKSSGAGNGNLAVLDQWRLFSCTNTKADRCTGPIELAGPFTTTCEASQEPTDPFGPMVVNGPGDDYPYDTQILCGIDLDDFGLVGNSAELLDSCSYPSSVPNSAPSGCILFAVCTSDAECDDGNECTIDTCNTTAGVCEYMADPGAACDNGVYCDGDETCNALGFCETTSSRDCDDGVACTIDSCDELLDSCINDPRDSLCTDGEYCNGLETCDAVNDCQAGTPPNCDDGIGCTIDSCNESTDTCDHTASDAACNDGQFCNGTETCDPLNDCQVGTPPDCTDAVGCTVDSCNETTDSCEHTANDASCSDGQFCNGTETCDVTNDCQAGTVPNCNDGVGCTVDSCNESTDMCDNIPDNGACDDGQYCNGAETCDVTNDCQAGTAPNCNDGVGCTVDSCNETTDSCDHTPDNSACSDGQYCNGVETCDAINDCQAGTAPNCADAVGCTIDSCNETTDSCDHTPNDASCSDGQYCNGVETCDIINDCQAGTAPNCDDGVGCTVDSCNESTDSCDNTPDNGACSDGQFCTGVEICDPVTDCEPGTDPCPSLFCNETTDQCVNCLTNADCDNSVYCDGAETCNTTTGDCEAGTSVNCNDGVSCTADSCNETTDSCDNVAMNASCDDGLYCNGAETCDPINDCQAGTAPNCADAVGCTVDSCNETTDSCDHTPNNAACNDGQYCNGVETCDAINDCQAGTAPSCTDGVGCTIDSCNETADSCDHTPNDASCSDGQYCNGVETCDAINDCQAGTAPDCADAVGCTIDSCNETTDSCDHTPNDASCSDGEFCNGAEICDPVNDCQAGAPTDCDDGVACTVDYCNETTDSCVNTRNNGFCNDGLFCNGEETCDPINDCVTVSVACPPDGFTCSIDSCDEATDTCSYDFSGCVCGDGEVTGTEECDPPTPAGTFEDCNNLIDDDGDGKTDCRDPDCKPGKRAPLCDEDCTLDTVCEKFIRDPGLIRYYFGKKYDSLWLHGRFPLQSSPDPIADGVAIEFSNDIGPFYRTVLGWGQMTGKVGGTKFKFKDTSAKVLGPASVANGLYKMSLKMGSYRGSPYLYFRVRAFGDFTKATQPWMTSQISVGTATGSLTAFWTARRRAWKLPQTDF